MGLGRPVGRRGTCRKLGDSRDLRTRTTRSRSGARRSYWPATSRRLPIPRELSSDRGAGWAGDAGGAPACGGSSSRSTVGAKKRLPVTAVEKSRIRSWAACGVHKPDDHQEKGARARHRSAHKSGPRRAKLRGRLKAPDVCASLRQSPAPTNTLTARPDADHTGDDARYANTARNRHQAAAAHPTDLTGAVLRPCATGPRPTGPPKSLA